MTETVFHSLAGSGLDALFFLLVDEVHEREAQGWEVRQIVEVAGRIAVVYYRPPEFA